MDGIFLSHVLLFCCCLFMLMMCAAALLFMHYSAVLNMEAKFFNLGLDIIALALPLLSSLSSVCKDNKLTHVMCVFFVCCTAARW